MRVKRVPLAWEVLTQVLQGKMTTFATNLPKDAQVVWAISGTDEHGVPKLEVILRSKEFEDISETEQVPYLEGVEGYERRISMADVLRVNEGAWDEFRARKEEGN